MRSPLLLQGGHSLGLDAIHTLDYTVISCIDLAATRAFYRDVMRFPIETDRETWVNFRVGSTVLALAHRPAPPEPAEIPPSPRLQLAFRVPPAELDACHQELLAHGVEILRGPIDIPAWNHRAFFFHDPEHTLIEIYAEL